MKEILTIRCPGCSERIEGADLLDLSGHLRDHLIVVHDIDLPPSRGDPSAYGASEENVERRNPEERAPRRRAPGAEGAENPAEIEGFNCPICGCQIEGSTEEELSSGLRGHVVDAHPDEPFERTKEKIGTR